jgi:hypothetical protein
MENIYVSRPDQLRKLRERLFDADYVQMLPLGQLVRSLRISDEGIPWPDNVAFDSGNHMMSILLLLPRLEQFTMNALTTSQTHLVAVSRNASDLTLLSLFIDADGDGVFEVLNRFRKLRSLALQFTDDDDDGWSLAADRPLRLPTVTHMEWMAPTDDKEMLLLLSRCRFASECHMKIKVDDAAPDHVGVLRPFFHAHMILSLRVEMPSASLSVLSAEIMRIPSVVFNGVFPSLQMMKIRPLPDTITIQNLNVDGNNEAKLWVMLAELCSGSDMLAKSTTLKLCRDEEQDWGWLERAAGEAGTRDALFVGRLLPWAAELHRRGIIIVDKYARDVTGFMPR